MLKRVWGRLRCGLMAAVVGFSYLLGGGIGGFAAQAATGTVYEAGIDLEKGGELLLSGGAELDKKWNEVDGVVNGQVIDMIPGKTVILDGNGRVQASTVGIVQRLDTGGAVPAAKGVKMSGDILGVKSYFLFGDEIVCMGAGLDKDASIASGDLVQVVDNVPVLEGITRASLVKPTNSNQVITAAVLTGVWKGKADLAVQQTHNTRNWIAASQRTNEQMKLGTEWSYVFNDSNLTASNLYCKFNSYGDTQGGNPVPRRLESWVKPKKDKTFAYTMAAEVAMTSLPGSGVYTAKSKPLVNSEGIQAACSTAEQILAVNKWDNTKQSLQNPVVDLTVQQPVSLVVRRDSATETTTLTVARPLDGAEPFIEISLKEKNSRLLSVSNEAALVEKRFGSEVFLKFDTSNMQEAVVVVLEKAPETKAYHSNDTYTVGLDLNKEENIGTVVINPYSGVSDYFDNYWSDINLNRMPGTTLLDSRDVVTPGDGMTPSGNSTDSAWVGGKTEQNGGAVKGIELTGGDITGKKSYMMFEDKIVCLGAGLTKREGLTGDLITVLDNTLINGRTTTKLNMSYSNKTVNSWLTSSPPWELNAIYGYKDGPAIVNDNAWIFLQEGSAPGLGYALPKADWTKAQTRIRSREVGGTEKLYYELWLNHGELDNVSYEYVMLPGRTAASDVKAYFDKPETVVLENNSRVQAVYDTKSQTLGVNFWDAAGGSVKDSRISHIRVTEKASVMMTEKEGKLSISVSDPGKENSGAIHVEISRKWDSFLALPEGVTVDESRKDKILLTLDVSGQDGKNVTAVFNTMPGAASGDELTLVRGEQSRLLAPAEFVSPVTWASCFLKPDGTTVNMTGYSKYKRELKAGESEGKRTAGPASADHVVSTEVLTGGVSCLINAKQKGMASIVATDKEGRKKVWSVRVLYEAPENLPAAGPEDYKKIRDAWKVNVVGKDLTDTEDGRLALADLETAAEKSWESYAYKGMNSCDGLPWPEDGALAGNPEIPFKDDAVAFRSVLKHTLAMAKAYATEGSRYYQNKDMLEDMKHILDWFSEECYAPKSQTDNWWNWEIGMPKDLVPLLILIRDDLTQDEIELYCRAMRFFQPDPFFEGAINYASTHAQGLRDNEGANLIDCAVATMGVGALLEDNEDVYLASLATSGQYIINQVEDSIAIPLNGYGSGFYEDGSYLDHSFMPYTGSYGIEFYRGGVSIASMLSGTPWEYGGETMENMERYVLDGFNTSIYRGHMLDHLKGRSVSRPTGDGRSAARDAMSLILRMLSAGAFTPEAAETVKSNVKNWLEADPEYVNTLKDAPMLQVRAAAEEILSDASIDSNLPPLHKNMAFMDRAVHRTDQYLFTLSMYSSRIQNCEVTNSENLYGWHQGDGATYLYNEDYEHYTENYWNTVNPYRLAGTTVVPVYIGNSVPDSSGFYQEGDYRSKEHWVGGSQLGTYGINGMSLSGDITAQKVTYAPDLRAKKSYFMIGEEIVCLGAGITNSGQSLPVETTIENRKLNETASNEVILDGKTMELSLVQNDLEGIVKGTENTEGTQVENPTWAYLEGNTAGSGIGYYFPKKDQTISLRKTENTGNWNLIGTSEGEAREAYLEMWFDHGVNPAQESYEYAILPGKNPDELAAYARNPGFAVLSNTHKIQAVYSRDTGITGINFWEGGKEGVASVKSDKAASVMLEETEDGILTIAVSDPTMRNTKTITLEVDRPIQSILSSEDNVDAQLTAEGTLKLVVNTKGTNGTSSYATVQLSSSIYPAAVTMSPGESAEFTVRSFGIATASDAFHVSGNQEYRSPRTEISGSGKLTVDASEKNGSLTVSAITENGRALTALVNLRGEPAVRLPEEIERVKSSVKHAFELAETRDMDDEGLYQAVADAIDAIRNTPNEALREYAMPEVLRLEELYMRVLEANGKSAGVQIEMGDELEETMRLVQVKGLILSIPYGKTASPSNASVQMRVSDNADKASKEVWNRMLDVASPSSAKPKADVFSANEVMAMLDAGKTVNVETVIYLEDEDGGRTLLKKLKAPVVMTFTLPENMGDDKMVKAYVTPLPGGEKEELSVSVDEESGTMRLMITGSGYISFTYVEKAGEPEEPNKPREPE